MKKHSIIPLILLIGTCISCSKGVEHQIEEYRTTMKFHDNFKVMQLTDLHLGVESDLAKQLKYISNSISTKTKILNDYFSSIQSFSSPTLIANQKGNQTVLSPYEKPKTLKEAGKIASELLD